MSDKNFDNFMKLMDSKDWLLIQKDLEEKLKNKSPEEIQSYSNVYTTTLILKEYHNWLKK